MLTSLNAVTNNEVSYEEPSASVVPEFNPIGNLNQETTNNLEAEAVNKKGVRFDEIAYYEVNDSTNNKTVQINPLNKEDIAVFQKIAFDNINNVNII